MRLVAAAVLISSVLAACSHEQADVGTVHLALSTPGGFSINQVSYTVRQGATILAGPATFEVSDPSAQPSLILTLPPGVGDTITVGADATDGHHFEGTSAEEYPLFQSFPYFDIYRKQVSKQADLVLALQLFDDHFGPDPRHAGELKGRTEAVLSRGGVCREACVPFPAA